MWPDLWIPENLSKNFCYDVSTMEPFNVSRPWGGFRQFTLNEPVTVKIMTVMPHQEFSLQYHKNRSEFWHILSGTPTVILGEEMKEAKPGDEFTVPPGINHRMQAGDERVVFLEVAHGTFDESDVIRLSDDYGRA